MRYMPTVFIDGKFRYYFFSREESRRHVHVSSPDGEVKIWLEPEIEVARVVRMNERDVKAILQTVQERREEIEDAWNKHFD